MHGQEGILAGIWAGILAGMGGSSLSVLCAACAGLRALIGTSQVTDQGVLGDKRDSPFLWGPKNPESVLASASPLLCSLFLLFSS